MLCIKHKEEEEEGKRKLCHAPFVPNASYWIRIGISENKKGRENTCMEWNGMEYINGSKGRAWE